MIRRSNLESLLQRIWMINQRDWEIYIDSKPSKMLKCHKLLIICHF
jgi:hypothetical protein